MGNNDFISKYIRILRDDWKIYTELFFSYLVLDEIAEESFSNKTKITDSSKIAVIFQNCKM